MCKPLLYYLFIFNCLIFNAQLTVQDKNRIEELKKDIDKANHDSVLINAYVEWDQLIYQSDPGLDLELNLKIEKICNDNLDKKLSVREEKFYNNNLSSALNNIGLILADKNEYSKAIEYYNRSLEIDLRLENLPGQAMLYNNIGIIYKNKGDYTKAIDFYNKSLNIEKQLNNKEGIAISLNNIGMIFFDQGNYAKAMEYYSNSLKIDEEMGNKNNMANTIINIGNSYREAGDLDMANSYYNKSLKIYQEIGDATGIATSYNNIGINYKNQGNLSKAMQCYTKSLEIDKELGNKYNIANTINNIGHLYKEEKDYNKALEYFMKGLGLKKEIDDKNGISYCYTNIGELYLEIDDLSSALLYGKKGLALAQEVGVIKVIEDASNLLYKVYEKTGDHKKALKMHELHVLVRDSVLKIENNEAFIKLKYQYKYKKHADSLKAEQIKQDLLNKAEQKRKDDISNKEAEKKNMIIIVSVIVCVLVMIFSFFIFKRFKVSQKQKMVIEIQHKELTESIAYARRIQAAVLPSDRVVKDHLKNSFIFYLPKDIVAGDFYWMEKCADQLYFAVADCTGHGVPGAIISVICNNGLNRSVREYNIKDPGKILDKTREIVIQEFDKSDDDVKDGMDIAICSIYKNKLYYAGANNPLWHLRKGELTVLEPDHQPIGKYSIQSSFVTKSMDVIEGDNIYLFTDGYLDQFGGKKGKKFKKTNFKKLLLSIEEQPMQEQSQIIQETFNKWKGDLEQIDDVCVMGVRV